MFPKLFQVILKKCVKKGFQQFIENVSKLVPGDHGLLRGQDRGLPDRRPSYFRQTDCRSTRARFRAKKQRKNGHNFFHSGFGRTKNKGETL